MLQVSRPWALRFEACLQRELHFLKGLRPLRWMPPLQGRPSKAAAATFRKALCAFAPSICNELHAYQLHCHKPTATVQAPAAFIEQMCLQMCMLQVCLHMCMLQLGLFNTGLKAAKNCTRSASYKRSNYTPTAPQKGPITSMPCSSLSPFMFTNELHCTAARRCTRASASLQTHTQAAQKNPPQALQSRCSLCKSSLGSSSCFVLKATPPLHSWASSLLSKRPKAIASRFSICA